MNMTDQEIMNEWYKFALDQPDSIESLLSVVRKQLKQSVAIQQSQLGISDEDFLRLRALKLPPKKSFKSDIHKIAVACNIAKPFLLMSMIQQAQTLLKSNNSTHQQFVYKAAFDEIDDLDEPPAQES